MSSNVETFGELNQLLRDVYKPIVKKAFPMTTPLAGGISVVEDPTMPRDSVLLFDIDNKSSHGVITGLTEGASSDDAKPYTSPSFGNVIPDGRVVVGMDLAKGVTVVQKAPETPARTVQFYPFGDPAQPWCIMDDETGEVCSRHATQQAAERELEE